MVSGGLGVDDSGGRAVLGVSLLPADVFMPGVSTCVSDEPLARFGRRVVVVELRRRCCGGLSMGLMVEIEGLEGVPVVGRLKL